MLNYFNISTYLDVLFHTFYSVSVSCVNMNHLLISIRYSIISFTTYLIRDVQMVFHSKHFSILFCTLFLTFCNCLSVFVIFLRKLEFYFFLKCSCKVQLHLRCTKMHESFTELCSV